MSPARPAQQHSARHWQAARAIQQAGGRAGASCRRPRKDEPPGPSAEGLEAGRRRRASPRGETHSCASCEKRCPAALCLAADPWHAQINSQAGVPPAFAPLVRSGALRSVLPAAALLKTAQKAFPQEQDSNARWYRLCTRTSRQMASKFGVRSARWRDCHHVTHNVPDLHLEMTSADKRLFRADGPDNTPRQAPCRSSPR